MATSRTVTLNNTATGSPTHYMASESSGFTGATWLTHDAAPSFTLSTVDGAKTVYFKVKNANGESAVVNDAITLNELPVVSTFQINSGAAVTTSRTVTLDNTATGIPTDYMASEDSGFTGAIWQTYAVAPSFKLSTGDGAKTVYFKVKNANGESAVVNDSIWLNEFRVIPKIAGGAGHTIALKSDGTVWAWGLNAYGQVGDGTHTGQRQTPVQVSGLSGVTAIAGGEYHTIALKSDGTVWAWGLNAYGQVGDGSGTISTPMQVSGLSGVRAIAGGLDHSIALKFDGTVWTWGSNQYGQLGVELATRNRPTPRQVSGLSGVWAIAGGGYHTIALKSDNTVWAWGHNGYGQLGDVTIADRSSTPVQVSGLSLSGVTLMAIAGGKYHSIALKLDGTVWAWGGNGAGQLGDGTNTGGNTPVQAYINLSEDDMTTSPIVMLFQINNGAAETTSLTVTLNNGATGNPTHYMASESASFTGATWLTYDAAPGFTLSTGDGAKTVYLKVKNANGESAVVNDAITLDTTAPTVSMNPVTSPTNVTSQTITGTVEAGATVQVVTDTAASDGAATVSGTTWSYTITGLVEGANGITVTATDMAGNTATASGAITLDATAPAVSMNAVTSQTNVTSQTITGTVEAGAMVGVATSTTASDGAATVTGTAWSYTITGLVEGANGITATATDTAGNTATATGSITLDTTAPTVSLNAVTSPTNVTSQTITSTVEAGATVGVATSTTASDGAATVTGTTWSYTITGLVEGANGITVTATDTAGNTATATGSITLDTTAPTVSLTTVTSPTRVTSQTITGTVESGATVSVATSTTASDGAATVTGTTWSYTITGLVEGANGITATATDTAGNTATATGSITLDTTAPTVSLNAVTTPTRVTSQTITGTVEAGAMVGVATNTAASDGLATVTGTAWSYTITGLVEGANGITVTATDTAGNTATATGSITLDTTVPTVSLTTVTTPTNATSQTITGAVEAGATVSVATNTTASDGAATVTGTMWSYTITGLVEGANGITATATDTAGNTATTTGSITLDTTVPTVLLNAVTSPTNVTSQTITGTVEAGATVSVATNTAALDGAATVTGTTWSYTITGLVAGANGITVTATDTAGNTATATGSITLDVTAPTVSLNAVTTPTNATSQTITGAVEAGATVSVATSTTASDGAATVTGTTWSYTITGLVEGANGIIVTATDTAGNTATASGAITLDTTSPSGTVTINSNAMYTNSTDVTLNLTATDGVGVTGYYASETFTPPSSGAEGWTAVTLTTSYSANVPFTLSSGDGVKTVYVWYKDVAGNVSSAAIDAITLNELPVVSTFQINNGAAETTSRNVTLNNTATGSPTHYMASESPTLKSATWKAYTGAPKFTLSASKGLKTVYFKVKNAKGASLVVSDSITRKKALAATVADAGIDQLARRGSVVTLDGSKSFDTEGNVPLAYQWSFVSLTSGMGSLLSDPKSVSPTFTLKRQGRCEIQLIVMDSLGIASEPDTVVISAKDTNPVAHAGDDQSISALGARVMLDGAQSYDPDGDAIAYQWAFISRPAESAAFLENADTAISAFLADAPGDYVIQLTITDSQTHSSSDTVTVSFGNVRPVANAGKSLAVKVGDTVTLAGDGADANGDALRYQWMLSSLPGVSLSEVVDSSARVTNFTPDRAGVYVAQLVVSDGELDSEPCAIQIQVFTTQTKTITALQGLETDIAELDSSAFKNGDMQNLLLNKLNAVIANVEAGKYENAANQLRNDVLPKMGGVESPEVDSIAWLIDRSAQRLWYQEAQDVVRALEMAR